ncbi:MAG: PE-PPE domain-containing protein [Mycobacteriaceae bacterium]|nr:PE-PPE domain-containing protein [Mycobacteriaceae bacterium]
MAGRHRKPGRHRTPTRSRRTRLPSLTATAVRATSLTAAAVRTTSLTAAAVTATCLTTALSTGTTVTLPAVQLTALITPANSTAQIFAGSSYYNRNWTIYGTPQVVPFLAGPQGIVSAVDQASAREGNTPGIVVLSSGWAAGQTSTALAIMQAKSDPAIQNLKLIVLDNNTNRAGGGFWTTYWMFAPLLFTSAAPTPANTNAPVLDVAYEYNINSDAPTYPIDLVADLNSLVAYVYDYGAQSSAPVPQAAITDAENPQGPHYHYIVAPNGTVLAQIPVQGNITYVTFESNRLPLVRPLLLLPGGNILADAVEPFLTALVDWGYKDNQPIPANPGVTRPVGLLPSLTEDATAIQQVQTSVPQGVQAGVAAAQKDAADPATVLSAPLNEINRTAGTSVTTIPTVPSPFSLSTNNVAGKRVTTPSSSTSTPTPKTNPVQQALGTLTSALPHGHKN